MGIAAQVAEGMCYLELHNYIHGDRSAAESAGALQDERRAPWAGCAYVMSRCRGGRCTFRTTHFTIHSMPSRTPLLWRQWV